MDHNNYFVSRIQSNLLDQSIDGQSRPSVIKIVNTQPGHIVKTVVKKKECTALKQLKSDPKKKKKESTALKQPKSSQFSTSRRMRKNVGTALKQSKSMSLLNACRNQNIHSNMPAQAAADGEGTEQSVYDEQTQSVHPVIDEDIQTVDETGHDYEHDSAPYHFTKDELDNVSQHLLDMCKVNASRGVVGGEANHGAALGDISEASSDPIVQPESSHQFMHNNEGIANASHVKTTCRGLKCFYQCGACDYAAPTLRSLQKHVRSMHGQARPYKCDFCDFTTASAIGMSNHQRLSHGMPISTRNKRYKCDKCGFSVDKGTKLVEHKYSAHQSGVGDGNATMTDISTTAANATPHDVQKRKFKCDACKFSAGNQAALWVHQLSRHLELAGQKGYKCEKGYKCDKCDYTTAEPDLIIKHRVKHTAGEAPTCMQTCDVCNNFTGTARRVAAHKCTVHNPVRRYKCDECSFASKHSANLARHKLRLHNAEEHVPLQKCSLCNYFGKPSGLAKHLCKPIEDTGGRLYTCDECGFLSRTSVGLELHRPKHGDEKPFRCDQCSFASKYKNCLTRHKRKHTGDKKYKCDICSYSSTHVCALGQHKRFHDPDRLFKCDMCTYGFDTSSALAIHKTRKHTSLTCDECGHVASNTRKLAEHKYKHAGVKPFKCNVCGFATHSSVTLTLHVKRRHGGKDLQCDMCDYSTLDQRQLEIHKCRHTGEKPFKCQQCTYSAFQWPELREHRRQAHSENYPHKCDKCEYAASTASALMLHIKGKHTDKRDKCSGCHKPHKCTRCNFASSHHHILIKHRRETHSMKRPYFCDKCYFATKFPDKYLKHKCRRNARKRPK